MTDAGASLLDVARVFLSLSLLTFGGLSAVLSEVQRQAVDVEHWLTAREFTELYAISQAAPGPNILYVSLIGMRAAGVLGGVVATLAFVVPSCTLIYVVAKVWDRFRDSPWRAAVQAGIAPITAGLIGSTAFILTRTVDVSWAAVAITAATAGLAFTRVNPLVAFAIAAGLGIAGFVG